MTVSLYNITPEEKQSVVRDKLAVNHSRPCLSVITPGLSERSEEICCINISSPLEEAILYLTWLFCYWFASSKKTLKGGGFLKTLKLSSETFSLLLCTWFSHCSSWSFKNRECFLLKILEDFEVSGIRLWYLLHLFIFFNMP